jgi:hypothetical protein
LNFNRSVDDVIQASINELIICGLPPIIIDLNFFNSSTFTIQFSVNILKLFQTSQEPEFFQKENHILRRKNPFLTGYFQEVMIQFNEFKSLGEVIHASIRISKFSFTTLV